MENDTGMILGKSFYQKLPTGTVGLDREIIDLCILFSYSTSCVNTQKNIFDQVWHHSGLNLLFLTK